MSSTPERIRVECPSCRHKMSAPPALAGQSHPCPKCGKPVLIPEPAPVFDDALVDEIRGLPEAPAPLRGVRPIEGPPYRGLDIGAQVLSAVGLVTMVLGLLVLVSGAFGLLGSINPTAAADAMIKCWSGGAATVSGLTMLVGAQALTALRDIARNSFRL